MSFIGSRNIEETENSRDEIILISCYFDSKAERIRKIFSCEEFIKESCLGQFGIYIHKNSEKNIIGYYPILLYSKGDFKLYDITYSDKTYSLEIDEEVTSLVKTYMENYDYDGLKFECIENSYYELLETLGDNKTIDILSKIKPPRCRVDGIFASHAVRRFNAKYYFLEYINQFPDLYQALEDGLNIN